jgi:hypothetical protein
LGSEKNQKGEKEMTIRYYIWMNDHWEETDANGYFAFNGEKMTTGGWGIAWEMIANSLVALRERRIK